MRTVAEIDKDIARWTGKVKELEADLSKAEESLTKIEGERAALLVKALGDGDPKAKATVEASTERWLRAMRAKGDLEIAVKQIGQKIPKLEKEREEVHKEELRQKKVAAFDELLEHVRQNPQPLGPWLETCKKFQSFAELIAACDAELGESKMAQDNLCVRYYQAVFFEIFRGTVAKPHPVYLGKSFLELLEERRARIIGQDVEQGVRSEEEREAASAT